MYTRVRLGHDIVDITPSSWTVAQLTSTKTALDPTPAQPISECHAAPGRYPTGMIDKKAAKALGIAAPQALLPSAGEVIE